eukprot:7764646-Pyramimonas_sp.AAC.1
MASSVAVWAQRLVLYIASSRLLPSRSWGKGVAAARPVARLFGSLPQGVWRRSSLRPGLLGPCCVDP